MQSVSVGYVRVTGFGVVGNRTITGVLVNERQSVGGDEVEEIRQLRLEIEQLKAMIDALRRDMRQARSLPAVLPAAKHELN